MAVERPLVTYHQFVVQAFWSYRYAVLGCLCQNNSNKAHATNLAGEKYWIFHYLPRRRRKKKYSRACHFITDLSNTETLWVNKQDGWSKLRHCCMILTVGYIWMLKTGVTGQNPLYRQTFDWFKTSYPDANNFTLQIANRPSKVFATVFAAPLTTNPQQSICLKKSTWSARNS